LIVEVHNNPAEALVDAAQQITPDEFRELVTACEGVYKAVSYKRNGG
jgi:3-deoxy-7-phosphoheptulonate synthase